MGGRVAGKFSYSSSGYSDGGELYKIEKKR